MSPKPRLNLCNNRAKPDKVAERDATLRGVLGRSPTPGTSPEILIVEDDVTILNALAYNLSRQGFAVHKALDGAEALKLTRQLRPDLILLDLMLPGEDGIRVCEKIRRDDSNTVIIMVTAKDSERDKVSGFEAGADDYVTKPFEILRVLTSQPGELKSREDLAKEVWGHAAVGSSRTIDVHIRRLRATLAGKSDYEYIHTVRGLGYRFETRPKGVEDNEASPVVEREIADPRE